MLRGPLGPAPRAKTGLGDGGFSYFVDGPAAGLLAGSDDGLIEPD